MIIGLFIVVIIYLILCFIGGLSWGADDRKRNDELERIRQLLEEGKNIDED